MASEKYRRVYAKLNAGKIIGWFVESETDNFNRKNIFKSAHDAALAYDKYLIQTGSQPINVLKAIKEKLR